jgi:glutathione synthase
VRFVFIMDPAETMLPDKDTSFAFMRGAQSLGHQCWHCLPSDVFNEGRVVSCVARTVVVGDSAPHVVLGPAQSLELGQFEAVFIRKDPPFDAAYLHLTQQLDLVTDATLILNRPQGLRDANEKLFAFRFAHLMPPSLVTSEPRRILDFLQAIGGRGVLKPLDGAGGRGVVALTLGDPNVHALIDLLTEEGRRLALVQQYLPAIVQGDKRVLLLDGEVLGAIRRVPRADDLRANIHVGGRVEATDLDARERLLVEEIGPVLREHGLHFVGLDLIDGRLIEINVTSPTGIQEMGRLAGEPLEQRVIAWVQREVGSRGRPH